MIQNSFVFVVPKLSIIKKNYKGQVHLINSWHMDAMGFNVHNGSQILSIFWQPQFKGEGSIWNGVNSWPQTNAP